MILFLPCGLVTAKKRQEPATMQLSTCGFDQEGAASARSDERIDLLD
ncbi:MAG TPA: hypothetical protein VH117_02205 [Edaphobacter sp.]|jgi:hypothetical protein|nr:hypothetical protein [Edaphobacter sp.]